MLALVSEFGTGFLYSTKMTKTAPCAGYHNPIPNVGFALQYAVINGIALKNATVKSVSKAN